MKNNYMPTAHAAIKHNHAKANIGKKKREVPTIEKIQSTAAPKL